jgi:transmembrane sensor
MGNYENFDVEDFLCDEFFIKWVLKPEKELDLFWAEWRSKHPDREPVIAQARKIARSIAIEPIDQQLSDAEVRSIVEYVEENGTDFLVQRNDEVFFPPQKAPGKNDRLHWFKIAASILFFIIAGIALNKMVSRKPATKFPSTEVGHLMSYFNSTGQSRLIRMSDGSLAVLKPNSKLTYPASFSGDKREVYLEGEAFFEVHKNHLKPFFVYAKNMVTKVLGTSFTVRAFTNDNEFKVVVNTGKVLVFNSKQAANQVFHSVTLVPNQEAIFQRPLAEFKKDSVTAPSVLSKEVAAKEFTFSNAPLSTVINKLEQAYHVNITYDEKRFGNATLTASLSNLPLDEKVKLIAKAINAQCDFTDGLIVIKENSAANQ